MHDYIEIINKSERIDANISFNIARECSKLLRNKETEDIGRSIIIHILNNWPKLDESTIELWSDIIEAAGFYPYLEKEKSKLSLNQTPGRIRMQYHKSENITDKYLHEEQKIILDKLDSDKNLIVSAPTSFGKSLLIEEIVACGKYKNIVIIQPTLALLDETRKKLSKYNNQYKLIIRTTQPISHDKGNLFLLTAERVMEYKDLPKIDFLVLDEFYKLSSRRDDERSDTLNNAFNLLVNHHKCRFYLLGPNIDGISEGFADKYNAEFYKTNYSLVENQVVEIYKSYIGQFGSRGQKRLFKEEVLFKLLLELKDEQTIIYCSSPKRVRDLSQRFLSFILNNQNQELNIELSLLKWIEDNIDRNWSLIECLKNGIGIHDGALQKHITSSIIDYFNKGKLKYLFCTTTIIEGVNTSAKNVIYFDSTKGVRKNIDYFDYCNIKGRSGRMMVHYVGRIFNFNEPPKKEQVIIDIPFFEQNPISTEVLIHLEDSQIKNKTTPEYNLIKNLPEVEKAMFRNNGLTVKGQINILNFLQDNLKSYRNLISWNGYPTYEQLSFILSLGWDNLIKPGESTSPMTKSKLVKVTFDYGIEQNINRLIRSNFLYLKKLREYENFTNNEILDAAIRDAFQILRHWFQYKVPKWLNVINELQTYVCTKAGYQPGNYTYYSSQIENDFVRENLAILIEYGIPKSAINKIQKLIPSQYTEDQVVDLIINEKLYNHESLIQYEKDKFIDTLI